MLCFVLKSIVYALFYKLVRIIVVPSYSLYMQWITWCLHITFFIIIFWYVRNIWKCNWTFIVIKSKYVSKYLREYNTYLNLLGFQKLLLIL